MKLTATAAMRTSAGTKTPQKSLASVLSASRLRAHMGQPRASEGTGVPQSPHGLSFEASIQDGRLTTETLMLIYQRTSGVKHFPHRRDSESEALPPPGLNGSASRVE